MLASAHGALPASVSQVMGLKINQLLLLLISFCYLFLCQLSSIDKPARTPSACDGQVAFQVCLLSGFLWKFHLATVCVLCNGRDGAQPPEGQLAGNWAPLEVTHL